VFKSQFVPLTLARLDALHRAVGDVPLLTGYVDSTHEPPGRPFRNAAALLRRDQPVEKIYKTLLPTYDVFDEARYFEPAETTSTAIVANTKLGVTICEDIWTQSYLPRRLYEHDP